MRRSFRTALFALSLLTAGTLSTAAMAADYAVDLSHSFIQFKVKHLGYSWLLGRFNEFSGTMSYDGEGSAGDQKISLEINPASIDSNWPARDKHLRSADFLDVEKFPKAGFVSTKYDGDATGGKLTGDLTLHGVTKSISFDIKKIAEGGDPWGGYRAGFEGSYVMDRRDFGMGFNLGPQANDVHLDLYIEAIRK